MPTLSSILVQRGAVSMRAIEDAIARQVLHGGDLPTNLLELNVVREDLLASALGEHTGLPAVKAGRIDAPPASTLRLLPAELAHKHGLFPLSVDGRTLVVAAAEPIPQAIADDLSFALDLALDARAALPVRIRQALAEHYGIPLDRRFTKLIAKLDGYPDARRTHTSAPPPSQAVLPMKLPRPVSIPVPSFGTGVADHARLHESVSPKTKTPSEAPKETLWTAPAIPKGPSVPQDLAPAPQADRPPETIRGFSPPPPAPGKAPPPAAIPDKTSPSGSKALVSWIKQTLHDGGARSLPPTRSPQTPSGKAPLPAPPVPKQPSAKPKVLAAAIEKAAVRKTSTSLPAVRRKGPFTAAMVERELEEAASSDAVLSTVFAFAQQFFEYSALFVLHGDLAEGRDAAGPGSDRTKVVGLGVPMDLPSSLATVRGRRAPLIAPLSAEGIDAELARDLGRPLAIKRAIALLPVTVKNRVVAILYGDDGEIPIDLSTVGDVISCLGLASSALARIALQKKLSSKAGEALLAEVRAPRVAPSAPAAIQEAPAPVHTEEAVEAPSPPEEPAPLHEVPPSQAVTVRPTGDEQEVEVAPLEAPPQAFIEEPQPIFEEPQRASEEEGQSPVEEPPRAFIEEPPQASPEEPPRAFIEEPPRAFIEEEPSQPLIAGDAAIERTNADAIDVVVEAPLEELADEPTLVAAAGKTPPLPDPVLIEAPSVQPVELSEGDMVTDETTDEGIDVALYHALKTPVGGIEGSAAKSDAELTTEIARHVADQAAVDAHRSIEVGTAAGDPADQGPQRAHTSPGIGALGALSALLADTVPPPPPEEGIHEEATQPVVEDPATIPLYARRTVEVDEVSDDAIVPFDSGDAQRFGGAKAPPNPAGADALGGKALGKRGPAPVFEVRKVSSGFEPLPRVPPPNATSWTSLASPQPPIPLTVRRTLSDKPIPREESSDIGAVIAEAAGDSEPVAERPPRRSEVPSPSDPAQLVERLLGGGPGAEEAAEQLIRKAETTLPVIMARFPGVLRIDRHRARAELPLASQCGPLLDLVVKIGKPALPFVTVRSASADVEVRFWATHVLGEIKLPEAASSLLPRLFDDESGVRRIARRSAAALVSARAGESLLKGLEHIAQSRDEPIGHRVLAIETMGEIRAAELVPVLIHVLQDASGEIADAARRALLLITRQDFGKDTALWRTWWSENEGRHRLEWLMDALMHDQPSLRRAAGDELKQITKEYFGYYDDLPKKDRERAQGLYRAWWDREGRRKFNGLT